MSGRVILLSLLTAAGTLGSCGASSGVGRVSSTATPAKGSVCQPNGSRTIAADRQARIYVLHAAVYGCSDRATTSYRLGRNDNCVGADRAGPVVLAGELAAYGLERCGVDTGFSQVVVRRLSDGKQLRREAVTRSMLGPESVVSVGSIVLRNDGHFAWIAAGDSIAARTQLREVHRFDAAGLTVLDSGPSIEASSLRLRGTTLSWERGQAKRIAELR